MEFDIRKLALSIILLIETFLSEKNIKEYSVL